MVLPYNYNQAADRGGRGRAFYERNLQSILNDPRYAAYRQDAAFQQAARDYAALWVANAQQAGRVRDTGFDFSGVDLRPYRHNAKPGTFWREGYFNQKGFGGGGTGGTGTTGGYVPGQMAQRYFGNLTGIERDYYQDNPEYAYQRVLAGSGVDPDSPAYRYLQGKYGQANAAYTAEALKNPQLFTGDYFAQALPGLQGGFQLLDARARGETPIWGSGTGGRSVW